MTTQRLRVGVIGAGVGAAHLQAYAQVPQAEIVALAGLDDDRVRLVANTFQVPLTFRDYQDLLALPQIDAVSVCLPNVLHAPVTVAALERGKHVLVEKPLARNAEEGRAMLAAAEQAGKVLMVAFNYRYRGDVQWLKQHIERGALGEVYYVKAHWMRRAGIPRLGSWFVSKEQAGGGPLIDLGVHVLDLALFLLGEPRPVSVSGSTYATFGPRGMKGWGTEQFTNVQLPYEVEDLGTAFVRLDTGATMLLEASWATHGSAEDDFGVTFYGTEGGAELLVRNYGHENTLRLFTDVNAVPFDSAPNPPEGRGHLAVVERFVAAALDGAPPVPSAEEGLRRAEVIDAIYHSAGTGQEVRL